MTWLWVALALLLAGSAVLAAGWALSDRFLVPRPYGLMPEFEIVGFEGDGRGEGTVRLPPPDRGRPFADTAREGTLGLLWSGGHGRLGPVSRGEPGGGVVRPLRVVSGEPPRAGEAARLDVFVFRRDPLRDHGLPYEDVTVRSDVGELAAWWLDGRSDTAVLMLHGRRRGERAETLRALPVAREGRSVLVLAYRNHEGSPPSPDGLFHYGRTEVADALAGLAYLAGRGVRRVVLVGFSMGGQIAIRACVRVAAGGAASPRIVGLVLDAPLIDPAATITAAVVGAGVPLARAVAGLGLGVASLRTGVRWRELDARRVDPALLPPVLLFTGAADATVPVEVVDAFARRLGPGVEYHRLDGVGHVEAWNYDPAAYEEALRAFLRRVTGS